MSVVQRGIYVSVVSLFDAIGSALDIIVRIQELFSLAIYTLLLLLDEVDKLKTSEFREETLYKIINGRYAAERLLVLSCNCSPDELVYWVGKAGISRLM